MSEARRIPSEAQGFTQTGSFRGDSARVPARPRIVSPTRVASERGFSPRSTECTVSNPQAEGVQTSPSTPMAEKGDVFMRVPSHHDYGRPEDSPEVKMVLRDADVAARVAAAKAQGYDVFI